MGTPFTLTFEDRGSYLFAHLCGHDSFEASLQYWQEICDKTIALGHKKLLVHENLLGELSKTQIFEIVTHFTKPKYLGIQLAFYDENMDDGTLNALGQLVATNRAARMEIFPSLDAAQLWIEQDDD